MAPVAVRNAPRSSEKKPRCCEPSKRYSSTRKWVLGCIDTTEPSVK